MNKFDKSLIAYISSTTDFADIDITVEEHHGRKYLIARVDVEKIDENSPKYDQSYAEKLITLMMHSVVVYLTVRDIIFDLGSQVKHL